MARKPRQKWTSDMQKVPVSNTLVLGTLTDVTAVSGGITVAALEQYRALSANLNWVLRDATEGPILVGYAHSDYSVAEIKECLEAAQSIDQGNLIAREQASRLVRRVGLIGEGENDLNDAKPIRTKLNWKMTTGDTLNVFAFNQTGGTLTTGAVIVTAGSIIIRHE